MVKQEKVIGFRASQEDLAILERLKKRLGIRADGELIRLALRCLDEKGQIKMELPRERYRHFCKKCGLTWFDSKKKSQDCDCPVLATELQRWRKP